LGKGCANRHPLISKDVLATDRQPDFQTRNAACHPRQRTCRAGTTTTTETGEP